MKRFLLLTTLSAASLMADTKLMFILQTNSAGCFPGTGQNFGCLPPELRTAGVMAFASTTDPLVTSFLFTATATLADGSTVTKTAMVERSTTQPTSAVVIWLAHEITDFSNVRVSVVAQRSTGDTVAGTLPGVEY